MPLAAAAAASPSNTSCASSSASSRDTTMSMPAARQAAVSSPNQSPPRGRGRMPSRPRHGPATQNTFACMTPNFQVLAGPAREATCRYPHRVRAAPRVDGILPARFHRLLPSTRLVAPGEATRFADQWPFYERHQASLDSEQLLDAGTGEVARSLGHRGDSTSDCHQVKHLGPPNTMPLSRERLIVVSNQLYLSALLAGCSGG
jgi:hypothetical protein